MFKLRASIAARLALGYGLLVALSIGLLSGVFYVGTIGVLDRSIDRQIMAMSERLVETRRHGAMADLRYEIERQLSDKIDSDTEIFLITSASGQYIAGNLARWPGALPRDGALLDREVVRYGKAVPARLILRSLPGGERLFVGRDLEEGDSIRALVWRALAMGVGIAAVFIIGGALLFRRQLGRRIGQIRRIALEIEAGDLSRRIPVSSNDEFGLLNLDINRMLDRIEQLMEGVRHVSNAIAHDLRTPLSRIRSKLDDVLRQETTLDVLAATAQGAIEDIDQLMLIFEKLLQIAAAESGMRPETLAPLDLSRIVRDIVELYDASAEEKQLLLSVSGAAGVMAIGERNLLGSALASLIDNALKYAGAGAVIDVSAVATPHGSAIVVRDNGPGIPNEELPKVTQRFYRLDKSRNLPGNGLGLSIVAAIATLHGGKLELGDAQPGLLARIVLPRSTP